MAFRALVDRLAVHITEQGSQVTRPSHLYITVRGGQARTPDSRDARAKVVNLTKKGERSLETAVLAWGEVEKRVSETARWLGFHAGRPRRHGLAQAVA